MVQISLQNSSGKVVFLGGFHRIPPPPWEGLGHQQKLKYPGHLNVNLQQQPKKFCCVKSSSKDDVYQLQDGVSIVINSVPANAIWRTIGAALTGSGAKASPRKI